MNCPECNTEVEPDAQTCSNCGTRCVPDREDIEETVKLTWHSLEGDEDICDSIKLSRRKETTLGHVKLAERHVVKGDAEDDEAGEDPDYELRTRIGEGGLGEVWEARQGAIDRAVAIKMIKGLPDDRSQEIFMSEAVATGNLEHPNIVPIYDAGRDKFGRPFYAMKNVRGVRWSDVIRERPQQENLRILLHVCDAVAFAHSRNVIHRDIKPGNVMLGDYGEVYLMDWGLAVAVGDGGKARALDRDTACAGTPAYMSPEMGCGDARRIGTASDIYLLGATLFEMVTGETPHIGEDVYQCLYNVVHNNIVEMPRKGELVDIARRAMATRPEDRYPDVKEFQQAIREHGAHRESIRLTDNALELLADAGDDYETFSHAVFGLREALNIWPENTKARDGLTDALLAYARSAFRKGDLDLAGSLLETDESRHERMQALVKAAFQQREEQQQRLEEVTSDLSEAGKDQTSILASARKLRFDPIDHAAVYRSAMEIGGGYHDFVPLDDNRLLAFVADADGMGVSAALDMVALRTVFRMMAAEVEDLTNLIRKLNREFSHRTMSSGRTVSACVCLLDTRRPRTFDLVCVGEMRALIYRRDRNTAESLTASPLPIGHDQRKRFNASLVPHAVTWQPGDMLLVYSPGVASLKNPGGTPFGHEAVAGILVKHGNEPVDHFMESLQIAMEAHCLSGPLQDDLTMAAVKYAAEAGFTTPDGRSWHSKGGTWYTHEGVIIGRASREGYLVCNQDHPDDVRFTVTMKATEGMHLSMWFAGSEANVEHDGYFVGLRRRNADLQRMGHQLAEIRGRRTRPRREYKLVVERKGGDIRVILDDNEIPLFAHTDPEPLRGEGHRRWGFYMWQGKMEVLEWQVEAL